jgi:hypothetical protein
MMHRRWIGLMLFFLALKFCSDLQADPVGTVFTYQGRLGQGPTNATGTYSFRFSCYDMATNGHQIGPTVTASNILVTDGSFVVNLDFGSGVFSGEARWLAIEVATNGAAFTLLAPRQSIGAAPYSLFAISSGNLSNPIGSSQIGSNQVVKSLNSLRDSVTILSGPNITLTTDSNLNQMTLSASVFPNNLAEYSAPGLYTITNTTASTRMFVELWGSGGGGGGGGGMAYCNFNFVAGGAGGNGGDGGYCRAVLSLVPGAIYKVRIGAGGTGGAGGQLNPGGVPGTDGQPGHAGGDTTIEDGNGTVLLRSSAGGAGGAGTGAVCGFGGNSGTNGPPGSGDLNAPIRRTGYVTGTIVPIGVTGGHGGPSSAAGTSGGTGGNGYALIQW